MCREWTLLLWTGMSSRAVREKGVKGGEGGEEKEEGRGTWIDGRSRVRDKKV